MAEVKKAVPANKWFKGLMELDGSVDKTLDPYRDENIVRSSSPSLNWIFANVGFGAPRNSTILAYGQAKSGKSLTANMVIQQELESDPNALAISFNTEIRGGLQSGRLFGIDPNRHITYDCNDAAGIFDKIEKEIIPMVDEGMPLKVLVIDSLNGIRGIKSMASDSVENHLIGDEALTLKAGLKRIVPLLKRRNILLFCTAHMAANIGAMGHAPKSKAALSFFTRHTFEYFIEVSRDGSAEGKTDILGNKFEGDTKDMKDNKQITGHRIFVKMDENSLGTSKRTGEFTIDYKKGPINTEDEIVEIAINTKVVERPNNRTYIFEELNFSSKEQFFLAVRGSKDLQVRLIDKIRAKDA